MLFSLVYTEVEILKNVQIFKIMAALKRLATG